jgi:hypothetical protein
MATFTQAFAEFGIKLKIRKVSGLLVTATKL